MATRLRNALGSAATAVLLTVGSHNATALADQRPPLEPISQEPLRESPMDAPPEQPTSERSRLLAGTFSGVLTMGRMRLRTEAPGDDASAPAPPQVYVAALGPRDPAWLVAPLAGSRESLVYDSQVDDEGILVLATYKGALARHPELDLANPKGEGLAVLRVSREGTVVWAKKVGESKAYTEASLEAGASSPEQVQVEALAREENPSALGGAMLSTLRVVSTVSRSSGAVLTATAPQSTPYLCPSRCAVGPAFAPSCGSLVCAKDPYCCEHFWDVLCVTLADERLDDCPCTHDKNTPGVRLVRGCDPQACPEAVCDGFGDTYCCNTYWDALCVDSAALFCGP